MESYVQVDRDPHLLRLEFRLIDVWQIRYSQNIHGCFSVGLSKNSQFIWNQKIIGHISILFVFLVEICVSLVVAREIRSQIV